MRVTNNMIVNKLTRSLNTTAGNLSEITAKVSSGKKFTDSSDDTLSAVKAYKIRRELSRNAMYDSNINEIKGMLDETETTLMGINEIMVQAKESLIQGSNGTMSSDNRATVAGIFESLKGQLLKLGNTNYAGKYIFGGTNTTTAPFTVALGKLYYNGGDVDSGSVDTSEIYIDLGLGLSFDGTGDLQKSSAFSVSTPGGAVLGTGVDSNGMPNNIYNLLSDIITSLKNNDASDMKAQINKLAECTDNIMVQVAGIGERVKFVEFISDRLSTDKLNLQEKQSKVEDIDTGEAIIDYNMSALAYKSSLQMGSKIIQQSLLDFLN
jgi:flagellar hook-associated protein 3 FlgL